ncbi:putative Ig domain-containing protein [bacterium]|nr:putative Ig domain-containing protein [bacterium]
MVFGPKQYHRTEGKPNVYTDSFAGVPAEGNIVVQNGDQAGNHRISSAIIMVNGVQVFGPNDFNQQVGQLEALISLCEENSISLELRGEPESYLTIKITGESQNYPPVADAGPDQTAFVTDTVQLDGSSSSDVDGDVLTYEWSFISVPAGSAAPLSDAAVVDPTFTLDLPGCYVAQLIVNDGLVDSDPDTVTISTDNSVPVANAGPDQTVFVDDTVTLDAGGSTDVDGDLLTLTWSFVSVPDGSTASLSDPSSVEPTFVVNVAGTYVIQLIVNDGFANSDPDTVTISTENRKPVADAGPDQTIFVDDMVTLDGGGSSDVDGDLLTFMWSFASIPEGSSAALSDPAAVNPCFDVDEPGTYVIQLIVNDGELNSNPDTVTISTENRKPVADAGPDQTVFLGDHVTLDGSGSSDVDGDLLTFMWSFTSIPDGSMAILSDPTALAPTFDVDTPGIYVVQLIANDGMLDSAPDTVTISTENRRPIANAGPDQTVFVTQTVTLDGSSSSDVDGDPLTYQWSFTSIPSGSAATLSDPAAVNPAFIVDMPGTYTAQLIVNDGLVNSDPDTVTITTENSPPVANAGPDQTVLVTETVQLDGSSSSDVDGDPLTYQWSFTSIPAGSTATLSDPTIVNPTFVIDLPGAYTVQLIVDDGTVDSDPDSVVISTGNSRPMANAGPDQTVYVTDTVQLDGSGSSDVDGNPLTCQWSFVSVPAGSTASLSDSTLVNPSFVVDVPGTYVVQLVVNDGTVDSDPDTVSISTQNSPPVANAGPDQTVFVGDTVALDGSMSSDVDGDLLTFGWSLTSIPDGSAATLSDSTAVNPTFVVDRPGSYVAQLIVNDGTVDSDPDTVTVTTENSSPIAGAGPDQTVFVTETVQLDGSGSSDADGDSLTFMWSFTSRPAGSIATLSDSTLINPNFVADLPGTYTVQLIVNDGTADSYPDSVVISTQNSRPVANAGSDQTVFVEDTVTLDGSASSDVDGDPLTYQWSFTSIPSGSGATLSDPAAIDPTFEADLPGMYVVQLIVNDGELDSNPDSVVITTENRKPVADAGPDQTVNQGDTVQLNGGSSSDPDGNPLTYSWLLTSAPSGSTAIISNPAIANPTFVADLAGTYVVQLVVNDGAVDSDPDTVIITANEVMVIVPDVVGMAQAAAEAAIIAANLTVGNITTQNSATVPAGNVISQDPVAGASVTEGSAVDMVVSLGPVIVNRDPEIISTPVTSAGVNVLYTYDVEATDPDGDTLTYSFTTTPSGMAIDSGTGLITWTPDSGQIGTHDVEIQVSDGRGGTDTQPYTILVSATANRAPEITSTPVTSASAGLPYQYDVQATDQDGYPLTFSLTEAPAGMLIDIGTGLIEWAPDTTQIGSHDVTVRVEDTLGAFDTQSFTVTVVSSGDIVSPEVTVTVNPTEVNPDEPVTITVGATDDIGVVSVELFVNGTLLPLDASNQAIFSSSTPGIFTATVTARDAQGNAGTGSEDFRVLAPGDNTSPTVSITSPPTDSEITVPTQIIGTASDANLVRYWLELSPKDQNQWTTFAEGTASVTDDVLGTLDTTRLLNGLYDIRLTAEDANGQESSTSVVYRVAEDLKVGNFTITLQDLAIPVAGIPITINRTYDSRDKGSHDFGYGWSIDIQNVKVTENRVLGTGWNQTKSGWLLPTYCLEPIGEHYVSITLPDGRTEEFDMTVSPRCKSPLLVKVKAVFNPRPGTFSTLAPLVDGPLVVPVGVVGPVNLTVEFDPSFAPYDPDEYQLTTPEGMVYVINQNTGIKTITDPNGNTLTYGSDGIIHSAGKSIVFTRDAQGRITRITDPKGGVIIYEYDAGGDLIATTDQEGNTTRYGYNSSHGLLDIEDPRGITPARNVYDDDGRLIAHIDAYGNRIEYTHNVDTRQEIVKDRLGNISVYEYDDDGNVLSETDPLGHTIGYTYDENGNKESKTDPLGNTTNYRCDARGNEESRTDPEGNTTSWTYNERNQLLTSTDPLGNITKTTYDANGNLLSKIDPMGNKTTNEYDTSGNLTSSMDCFGTTTYKYDTFGNNKISEIDPLDNETTYTYDANGNELSKTTTRTTDAGSVTMTTRKHYDNLNRLIKTIDPDGNETITEYNAIGKKSATVDKNGNRTTYEYDLTGNLIKTTYPDGSTETVGYDANGNRLTSTDRAGRTTRYEYDAGNYGDIEHPAGNRLVRTIFPDGSGTRLEYDAAGRLIATIDENGSRLSYEYDAAGRRTKVVDALGNVTTFTYDANGNEESMIDANGNTITHEYDALNRKIKTIFPDGTFTAVEYAGCGTKRKSSETDQAGNITRFEYDALGRLTKVIDALGGETTCTYDEAGNKLTQTDPNGNTTRWAYNNLGRMVEHTLPMGMFETFTYDPHGNVIGKTDFNGDTITYTYDVTNRLIKKSYSDGSEVLFTYTATGRRQTVTDARGITSYKYDLRDRLVEVINPDGTAITYAYDPKGNRTSVAVPSGNTTYTYDTLNRLETVTDPEGGVTGYTYDSAGNRASVTYPNGTVAEYIYDALNRLTYLENRKSTGEVISSYTYTLGPAGNRTRVEENSGRVVNYTYDNLYRLTEEQITDPVLGNETISYMHDGFGNRLAKTDSTGITNYTYNANDQLVTETAPAYTNTYTYDGNGNTKRKSDGTTVTDYTYDYENKLIVAQTGASQTSYAYDADGIRVKSTSNGAVTQYLVDKNRRYAQVLEEADGSSSLIVRYMYGDDLISQNRGGVSSCYHYDGQMSTRKLTNTDEEITDSYIYDAFGIVIDEAGTTENNYLYTGEQYDPNVGFYYLRARYYNAAIGRFMTHDPRWGNPFEPMSLHKYLYANANPINFVDPSGEIAIAAKFLATIVATLIWSKFLTVVRTYWYRRGSITPVGWSGRLGVGTVGVPGSLLAFGGIIASLESTKCYDGREGKGKYLLLMTGVSFALKEVGLTASDITIETPKVWGTNPLVLAGPCTWGAITFVWGDLGGALTLAMSMGMGIGVIDLGPAPGFAMAFEAMGGWSFPLPGTLSNDPC